MEANQSPPVPASQLPTNLSGSSTPFSTSTLGNERPSDWEHYESNPSLGTADYDTNVSQPQPNLAASQVPRKPVPQTATSSVQTVSPVSSAPVYDITTDVLTPTQTIPERHDVQSARAYQSSSTGTQTVEEGGDAHPQIINPYDDLDPWFTSSLERFVAMLRKEAVADGDEERFRIFTSFAAKESKLREVMYNIEQEKKSDDHTRQLSGLNPANESPAADSAFSPKPAEDDSTELPAGLEAKPDGVDGNRGETEEKSDGPPGPHVESSGILPKHTLEPMTMNPPQPIYIPFRYAEGPQRESENLSVDRPASQAYSALRQASNESGRVTSNASDPGPAPRAPALQHDGGGGSGEKFIGLIREKSLAYRKKKPEQNSAGVPLPGDPDSVGRKEPGSALKELRTLVSVPLTEESEFLRTISTEMQKYGDNFGYIKEASVSWQEAGKESRKRLEDERVKRQEESEANIDALFNEKSIGYADINTLEEDFRQTEARVQLEEERREVDDFIEVVADPLDARLADELTVLRVHYDTLIDQLGKGTGAGKSSSVADRHILAETMKMVMSMYPKLESRYQKRLDIGLDRERRRKKAERRPYVFIGDSVALKQLDGEFDKMERRNIFVAARDRDDRTNLLMDAFDAAITHGLGENQNCLDEVSAKLKRVESEGARSSGGSPDTTEVKQVLEIVEPYVASLRANSESIFHSFGLADSALNDADYSVAVAESQYAGAEEEVFYRLKTEKRKEDARIRNDFESKLKSVRDGPTEILNKVKELLAIGVWEPKPFGTITGPNIPSSTAPAAATLTELPPTLSAGHHEEQPIRRPQTASNPGGQSSTEQNLRDSTYPVDDDRPLPLRISESIAAASAAKRAEADPEHGERIRKALEDAKRRNAVKNQSISN